MGTTLTAILDEYCLARSQRDITTMLDISNHLVNVEIPELIQRLGEVTIERNQALEKLWAASAA